MLKKARLKVAESIDKIEKPDDWHWNRWLKKPTIEKGTFEFPPVKNIKQTSLDSSFEPTKTFDATTFVYSRGLFDKKVFNKFLQAKATKNISAIFKPAKTERFFFVLVKSEIGKNLTPVETRAEIIHTTILKEYFKTPDIYNYKQKVKPVLTKRLFSFDDPKKSIKDTFSYPDKLRLSTLTNQLSSWKVSDEKTVDDAISKEQYFIQKQSASENLLQTGKDAKFISNKTISKYFFESTIASENLLTPATTIFDIKLLNVEKFSITIYDYSFSEFQNKSNIASFEIPSIEGLTKAKVYKLNRLQLSAQQNMVSYNNWSFDTAMTSISILLKFETNIQHIPSSWLFNYKPSSMVSRITLDFAGWKQPEVISKSATAFPVLSSMEKVNLEFTTNQVEGLYQFQKDGVQFLINNNYALLADDHGLGKSVQTIYALRILLSKRRIKKALIVSDNNDIGSSYLTNSSGNPEGWEGLFNTFAPELKVNVLSAPEQISKQKKASDVSFISYKLFKENIEQGNINSKQLEKYDCLVVDSFQKIKAINFITGIFSYGSLNYLWLLSNRVNDDANLITDNFKSLINVIFSAKPAEEEFNSYILQRKKEEVQQQVPSKIFHNKWFNITDEQIKEYEIAIQEAEVKIYSTIERGNYYIVRPQIFSLINQLMQVCNFASNEFTNPKADYLLDYILNSSEKILILSQYEKYGLDKLEKLLQSNGIEYSIIKIGMQEGVIQHAIQAFKTGRVRIFLLDSKAIQKKFKPGDFSTIIHFDHSWNPASVWQLEDKIEINGNAPVNIFSYLTKDTIEEKIYSLLAKSGLMQFKIYEGFTPSVLSDLIPTEELLSLFNIKAQEMTEVTSVNPEITFEDYLKLEQDDLREAVKKFLVKLGFSGLKFLKYKEEKKDDVAVGTRIIGKNEESALFLISAEKTITNKDLQEFISLFSDYKNLSKAFIITSGVFSPECKKYLGINNKFFCLIDGRMFYHILQQFKLA